MSLPSGVVGELRVHRVRGGTPRSDYKNGEMKVEVQDNKQLMCYINLARELFPGRKRFYGTIVQPKVFENPITVEFTEAELDETLLEVVEASASDDLVAGAHCTFCPLLLHKGKTCPEAERRAREAADADFDEIINPDLPEDCVPSDEEIGRLEELLVSIKIADALKKKIEEHLIETAKRGVPLVNLKVVDSWGWRRWRPGARAAEIFEEAYPDKVEDIYDPKRLKSPNQIQKICGISRKEFDKLDLTDRRKVGYKLVKANSKTPASNFGASDFEVVTSEDFEVVEE